MQREFGKVLPGTRIAWQAGQTRYEGEKMLGPGWRWNLSWLVPDEQGFPTVISYKFVVPPDDVLVEILDNTQ